jgi:uncharacterized membrane protein
MSCVAGRKVADYAADYVHTARRNNSLSSSGRYLAFGFILAVSLGIAAAFSLILGAWPILPYAGIEMLVLYLAFRYVDRHAGDYERITVRDCTVAVEVKDGERVSCVELDRYWAQVLDEPDGRILLRSHGREIELGRHLRDEERRAVSRELRRELRRERPLAQDESN